MPGPRAVKFALALLTSALAITSLVMVPSAAHDEDDAPQAQGPARGGPKPGAPVAMPPGLIGLELRLGLKDQGAAEWEGEVKVSEGRVVEMDIERGRPDATVEGARFSVGTVAAKKAAAKNKKAAAKNKNAPAKNKNAPAKKQAQAKKAQAAQGATLALSLDAPASATVTVTTRKGEFSFKPADLPARGPKRFLDDEASVERVNAAIRLTPSGTEDDFPAAVKGPDGSVWLASVAYRPERPTIASVDRDEFDKLVPTKNGDRIELRRFDGKTWHPALNVTDDRLDVWRPAVAVDGQGVVWVAWAQQVDGDWDIFTRRYTPGRNGGEGSWSDVSRVTDAKGSDFHVVAATDSQGTVWLAWQAWRDGNYEVLAAAQKEGHAWAKPRTVSDSTANDWGPAIAADGKGNVYVAWDTYDKGNYDVRLRNLTGAEGGVLAVAGSARFEGRPHLACDKEGRVWVAYEEGDEQWGKDFAHAGNVSNVGLEKNPGFALYINRTVRVKCLAGGKLLETAGKLDDAFKGNLERGKSLPRLAVDDRGAVWLTLRHHPLPGGQGETWVSSYLRYDGREWSAPRRVADSANLMDNRPALVPHAPGVLIVYSGDRRVNTQNRREDDLYASLLAPDGSEPREMALEAAQAEPPAQLESVHPNEPADVARMRAYRVEHGGKSLRLLRGEFHRHTEFSAHNDGDGMLEDTWRYAQDAGRLDWMGNGDHDNGFGHEYMWWLIQKSMDLHHNAPAFIPALTYERSVVYPNGHRNVMMPKRGIRPLPRGGLPGTAEAGAPDTKLLYDYLKHFGGICASHTSGTNMGTDWRDNDPTVEPVVEIYQGHRHNYEHFGAPKSATPATQIGGYEPAGFIWNALQKGYKLGFQSSSDHVSTHLSYAVVLTDDVSRQGIIDAFKKRHCYAATDNIVLDVRSGEHLMGDTFEAAGKPSLTVSVQGTAPILKVHVIRDNKYVLTTEPNAAAVKLNYTDDDARPGESHYYYVRVEQADRNLAWASPIWVTVK